MSSKRGRSRTRTIRSADSGRSMSMSSSRSRSRSAAPAMFLPYARRMTATEAKNIDSAPLLPAVATTTGVLTVVNACTAGGLPTNRVGRRITVKSVFIRGQIQLAASTTGSCPIRLILFYDKQTNKAAPGAVDLLNVDAVNGIALLANSHRFRVLRDIVIPVIGTAGPQAAYFNEYVKCNLQTEFIDGAGAGTVADITTGGLFLLAYANNLTAVQSVTNGLQVRVRFTDA